MGVQRLSISHDHLAEVLSKEENTTLQSDETRKSGESFEVYAARDKSQKEWILGLRDISDKSVRHV